MTWFSHCIHVSPAHRQSKLTCSAQDLSFLKSSADNLPSSSSCSLGSAQKGGIPILPVIPQEGWWQ